MAPLHVPVAAGPGTPALADFSFDSGTANAAYQLKETGDIYQDDGGGFADTGTDWIAPKVGMDGFEVRATLVAGVCKIAASSPLSTWLNLGTERHWACKTATVIGVDPYCDLTIEIRPVGGVTVTSANIHLSTTLP